MSPLPKEPIAFTDIVAERFRDHLQPSQVEVAGELELLVDGRRVNLDDLLRATNACEESDGERIVASFIDAFVNTIRLNETPLPFDVVRNHILPQIRPMQRLMDTDPRFVASQPFINDTVILYMIDLKHATAPLSTEQLVKWGVEVEEVDDLSRRNLAAIRPELQMQLYHCQGSIAALFNIGDGYDASRLLLQQLYPTLAPEFGGNFLVAIPSRDIFIAFPPGPMTFIQRLRDRVKQDFQSMPYPITDDLFLVTLDGVAPWQPMAA